MQNITKIPKTIAKFIISHISCASCPDALCIFANCNIGCEKCFTRGCYKEIKEEGKSLLHCRIRRKIFRVVYEKFWYWSD